MASQLNLSRRERQIVEALFRLNEASVAEVQKAIDDPPNYSAVRAILTELVRKKQVKFRRDGTRYLYRPKAAREKVAKGMVKNLVANFFRGSPSEAICTLLEEHAGQLTADDIERIKQQIEQAESEARDVRCLHSADRVCCPACCWLNSDSWSRMARNAHVEEAIGGNDTFRRVSYVYWPSSALPFLRSASELEIGTGAKRGITRRANACGREVDH
ncbi:MAG: BlaI/MecI/CopY family transcriptional regulator [Pirellulaceae bacterium]